MFLSLLVLLSAACHLPNIQGEKVLFYDLGSVFDYGPAELINPTPSVLKTIDPNDVVGKKLNGKNVVTTPNAQIIIDTNAYSYTVYTPTGITTGIFSSSTEKAFIYVWDLTYGDRIFLQAYNAKLYLRFATTRHQGPADVIDSRMSEVKIKGLAQLSTSTI